MDNNNQLRHPPVGPLADIIVEFIRFKRGLGYIYKTEEGILHRFSLVANNYVIQNDEIPLQLIEEWLTRHKDEKASSQRTRGLCVLQMLHFASRRGFTVHFPVLIKKIRVPKYIPYIFTRKEIKQFFYACDNIRFYPGTSKHHIIPIIFRLIYSCGLRSSEAANLKSRNVDLTAGIITVKEGKNGKDRLIPLSDSMTKNMAEFSKRYHNDCCDLNKYFFKGKYRNKIDRHIIYKWFRICLEAAGIRHLGKGRGPREHDLRHSFCVHSLKKMQEQGIDLYASLPILSTYLGHASINETQHYLRLTAEFFPDVIAQTERKCRGVIPSVEVDKK